MTHGDLIGPLSWTVLFANLVWLVLGPMFGSFVAGVGWIILTLVALTIPVLTLIDIRHTKRKAAKK